MKHDPIDVAWAAGFYEGEGCVSKRSRGAICLDIGQATLEPLEKMRSIFGGVIYECPDTKGGKRFWIYRLKGADAVGALAEMYVHLSPRRQGQIRETVAVQLDRYANQIQRRCFCKHGHPKAGNVGVTRSGRRYCRPCITDQSRARRGQEARI